MNDRSLRHDAQDPESKPVTSRRVTSVCGEYLATSTPAGTMTNTELAQQLRASSIEPGEFTRILELNETFGGIELPAPYSRPTPVRYTIGIPPWARSEFALDGSVPFFDFGVAAPCGVELLRSGMVVADFSDDLPPVEVAETFEVFVEGLAREWLAPRLFESSDGRELPGEIADVMKSMKAEGFVAEASDRWTSWWQTDEYVARLSTMWDHQRAVRFVVWHGGKLPAAFAHLFTA